MTIDIEIKESAKTRIVSFLNEIDSTQVDHALQCFPRAACSLFMRRSKTRLDPAAVIAYYDGDTTIRMFDNTQAAFNAYVEYKEERAPAILLTVASITIQKNGE
jgi:hypothetical protein